MKTNRKKENITGSQLNEKYRVQCLLFLV